MSYYLPDIFGTLGSILIISVYLALQLGKLSVALSDCQRGHNRSDAADP
jgi:hypothetical protein